MVNRVRIHPVFYTSARAIVMASNGKSRAIDGRDRNQPLPPLDLDALANDVLILSGKLNRAHSQLTAIGFTHAEAQAQAATRDQLEAALAQTHHMGALLDLIREAVGKWDREEQPGNRTLRGLAELLDIGEMT